MAYTDEENANRTVVEDALKVAATDFSKLGENIFSPDVEWTITGHGPVARTFHGMKDLIDNAEQELFDRWAKPAAVTTKGVWADGDKVFVHMRSATTARDGQPYANEYMYILTMRDQKVVAGTAWLDLYAYYDILERVNL